MRIRTLLLGAVAAATSWLFDTEAEPLTLPKLAFDPSLGYTGPTHWRSRRSYRSSSRTYHGIDNGPRGARRAGIRLAFRAVYGVWP